MFIQWLVLKSDQEIFLLIMGTCHTVPLVKIHTHTPNSIFPLLRDATGMYFVKGGEHH